MAGPRPQRKGEYYLNKKGWVIYIRSEMLLVDNLSEQEALIMKLDIYSGWGELYVTLF